MEQYSIQSTALPRARVVSLGISAATFSDVREAIIRAAHQAESRTVCFPNAHMVVEAQQKPELAKAVNNADWVLADGVPLLWAIKRLYGRSQERVAGMDMMPALLERAATEQIPVLFYGSTTERLEQAAAVCHQRFPGLNIAGLISPPFRPLTAAEEEAEVEQIKQSGARLIFVALGCPKQELWMGRMRGRIPAVMLGIGGALPILTGEHQRAPAWIRSMGLEWVFRLALEPRRLFRRYATTNALYVWHLGKQVISSH
ncbi:WecB/TagA/CpsF family glycosyltransferase [Fibrella aquatica]|jgi:N-acetylglucosaminyldiphosphoundecaprenol N-acetyl-beta-D-mannosaminyltransferase|uniref:WecB/TagA/CpsF family glycosyltransferase n=1 Tax=Fibrella aquatica TaxID=3242487 RepID=UPI00351FEA1F